MLQDERIMMILYMSVNKQYLKSHILSLNMNFCYTNALGVTLYVPFRHFRNHRTSSYTLYLVCITFANSCIHLCFIFNSQCEKGVVPS